MGLVLRICFIPLTLALLADPQLVAANDIVDTLKEKVSDLKANIQNSDSQDQAFSVEQEEFDRMREQLLAAEKSILEKTPRQDTVSAEYHFKQDPAPKTPIIKYTGNSQSVDLDDDFVDSREPDVRAEISKRALAATNNEFESLKSKYELALAKLSNKEKDIKALEAAKNTAEAEAKAAKEKILAIQKEHQTIKNKLLVSETEVERLSSLAGSGIKNARLPSAPGERSLSSSPQAGAQQFAKSQQKAEVADLSIVTVIADKAYLRTGPSKDDSPLMEVKSGTRLAVENKQGQWYRVTTPTGARAWITKEVVAFGPSHSASLPQTVKVKSYEGSTDEHVEDKAFELISKHSR